MNKYKMPSTEFLTLIAEDFDNGAIKDAIWEGLRNGELLQAELDKYRWIPVEEQLPEKVKYYAVTDGLEWWRELWCFVDHSGAMGWEDNPDCITHWKPIILPEGE